MKGLVGGPLLVGGLGPGPPAPPPLNPALASSSNSPHKMGRGGAHGEEEGMGGKERGGYGKGRMGNE